MPTDAPPLRAQVVLRVAEGSCELTSGTARFAPQFPTPHVERVAPGHVVAVATAPSGADVVLWRWYDAVVLADTAGGVRLWEPAHGEVDAQRRRPDTAYRPGSRAYASAGLPGAEWWVAGPVGDAIDVELDEVARLYTEHGLWDAALGG